MDLLCLCYVCRNANSMTLQTRDLVESFDCLIKTLFSTGFSRCQDHFLCTSFEKSSCCVQAETSGALRNSMSSSMLVRIGWFVAYLLSPALSCRRDGRGCRNVAGLTSTILVRLPQGYFSTWGIIDRSVSPIVT